jgi:DNA-binding NarL/FixJ family response regulator
VTDERLRIAIVNMPQMLREIIREVVSPESDMEVAGEFSGTTDLLEAVERTRADFVITGTEDADVAGVGRLLRMRPRLKVLAVAADGRQTYLYELRPQKVHLGEVSPQNLLDAIRSAARGEPVDAVS